jgi:hypothetical protein
MGRTTSGVPDAICSFLVKDPTQPWDNVPQTELNAAGLHGQLKAFGAR